jgi:DNA replication ATP-dependent helicase Dna2
VADNNTTSPKSLIDFVQREQAVARADQEEQKRLSIAELVERGDALDGLVMVARTSEGLALRCDENVSRLRIGDRLELRHGASRFRFEVTVADLLDHGRELYVHGVPPEEIPRGPWIAQAVPVDVFGLITSCIRRLRPGAPGWSWLRTLVDREYGRHALLMQSVPPSVADLAEQHQLDDVQRNIFLRCCELPTAFGVQGPPGTGKTKLLALVAEAAAKMGKRVLVVGPTHQAVNNALSTVRRMFPHRRAVKVGDELRREALEDTVECRLFEDGTRYSAMPATADTITGMTLITALHRLVLRRSGLAPNVVLVEEAGQVPLSQGACVGLIGAGSILLFGDDLQMPPIFQRGLADDPLARSLFASLRSNCGESIQMLETTYRLNGELCDLVSQAFYDGRLRSSESARGRQLPIDATSTTHTGLARTVLAPEPAFVVARSPAGEARQVNAAEADFVADITGVCLRLGLPQEQVAVVTPFRRQAAMIRSRVQAQFPVGTALPIIDTVERVQGLTVEVVVVSLSSSDPHYIDALGDFLFQPNRLNVALSRARTKAILVASTTAIDVARRRGHPAWRTVLKRADQFVELG